MLITHDTKKTGVILIDHELRNRFQNVKSPSVHDRSIAAKDMYWYVDKWAIIRRVPTGYSLSTPFHNPHKVRYFKKGEINNLIAAVISAFDRTGKL